MHSRAASAFAGCLAGALATVAIAVYAAPQAGSAAAGQKKALVGPVKPIGPYSPGVVSGNLVFLAGQIGLDPATGNLVEGGTKAEARQAMENLGKVLQEAGLSFEHVVKTTIFLVDIKEFADVNEVYGSFFPQGGIPPARSTVQVAALPRSARIEIDFIAAR